MKKIQISINDKLVERVDEFCEKNFMNRSQVFSVAVLQYMNSYSMPGAMLELASAFKSIAKNGEISDDDKKKLEAFVTVAEVYQDEIK